MLARLLMLPIMLVAAALACAQVTIPDDADLARAVGELPVIVRALGHNDRAGALRRLEAVIPRLPERSLPRHTAELLRNQMLGKFAERHKRFLDRQVVDTVVLVPDEVSFVEAIKQWPADRFWPVLIEDAWFAPLFIEAFAPRHVARYVSPNQPEASLSLADRNRQVTAIVARAMGEHLRAMTDRKELPPGIVVIDPTSPQRAAGLALAMGHVQPLLAVTTDSSEMTTARESEITQLNERILAGMSAVKLLTTLDWSGITLAGRFPIRYNTADPKFNPTAVDDRLGRDEREVRRGVVGRLTGNLTQSVYMAMSSLFLQPRSALLVHTYGYAPESIDTNPRSGYHLTHAADLFAKQLGLSVKLLQNDDATLTRLRQELGPGEKYDLFWINSSGGDGNQSINEGPMDGDDMPVGRADVVYHVASWGLMNPWSAVSMASKGMSGGAYWYFGSTHEPYLHAFVQSTEFANRAAPGTPLAFAARHLPGHPMYRPWKLMLIGDPLFGFRPTPPQRIEGEAPGTAEIRKTEQPTLTEAMFLRSYELTTAKSALVTPAKLSPDELAAAMRLVYQAGELDAVSAVPERLAARHVMASLLLRRVLREQFETLLSAKQVDAARTPLSRMVMTLDVNDPEVQRWCTKYLDAAAAIGQREHAVEYLKILRRQTGISPYAATGIDMVINKKP